MLWVFYANNFLFSVFIWFGVKTLNQVLTIWKSVKSSEDLGSTYRLDKKIESLLMMQSSYVGRGHEWVPLHNNEFCGSLCSGTNRMLLCLIGKENSFMFPLMSFYYFKTTGFLNNFSLANFHQKKGFF